eukprot:c6698_g1_i1 orf=432-794(+)
MAARSAFDIQKVRRLVRYAGTYLAMSGLTFFYVNLSTRAGISRASSMYSLYPVGTDILFDAGKLYTAALGNAFEEEEWGTLEFVIMAKHFERQGKSPYAYHAQYMGHLLSNGQLDVSGLN